MEQFSSLLSGYVNIYRHSETDHVSNYRWSGQSVTKLRNPQALNGAVFVFNEKTSYRCEWNVFWRNPILNIIFYRKYAAEKGDPVANPKQYFIETIDCHPVDNLWKQELLSSTKLNILN